MLKKDILSVRDTVSATVHDLIWVTVDVKSEIITITMPHKEIKLCAEELWSYRNSAKKFIGCLKEKMSE